MRKWSGASVLAMRGIALVALTLLLSVPPRGTQAESSQTSGPLRVTSYSHGLKVMLVLSRHAYPRDALIRARVEITNSTSGTVYVAARNCPSPGPDMQVEVLGGGQVLYPPAVVEFVYPSWGDCPNGPTSYPMGKVTALKPGESVIAKPLAILRASLLRVNSVVKDGLKAPWRTVLGAQTRVTLTSPRQPTLRLHTSPQYTYADLMPAPGARGALLYMGSTLCGPIAAQTVGMGTYRWMTRHNDRVFPDCPSDTFSWHAVAGWLGQSVATIDYSRK